MSGKNATRETPRRRVTVRYTGHVQGVGFRFTTIRIATRFDITGYVRNEEDGSVCCVAEGDEAVLLEFLRAIRLSPLGRYIQAETAAWSEATGQFNDFDVRF